MNKAKFMRRCAAAAAAACLCAAGPAAALMVMGDQAAAPPQRPVAPPHAAPHATHELIAGTISAIDALKRTMTVSGNTLAWHPTHLRVFMQGGLRAAERDLRAGMRVRFALEPVAQAADGIRRAVLIYVDER